MSNDLLNEENVELELKTGDTFEVDGERFVALHIVGDHKASDDRYVTYIKGHGTVTHTAPLAVMLETLSVVTPLSSMVPFGVTIAITPSGDALGEIFERVLLQTMRINVDRFTAFDIRDEAVNVINDPATADNAVGYWNNAQVEIVQDNETNGGEPFIQLTLWGIVNPDLLDNAEEFIETRNISTQYNTCVSHVEMQNNSGDFVVTPEMSINLVTLISDGDFSESTEEQLESNDVVTH